MPTGSRYEGLGLASLSRGYQPQKLFFIQVNYVSYEVRVRVATMSYPPQHTAPDSPFGQQCYVRCSLHIRSNPMALFSTHVSPPDSTVICVCLEHSKWQIKNINVLLLCDDISIQQPSTRALVQAVLVVSVIFCPKAHDLL